LFTVEPEPEGVRAGQRWRTEELFQRKRIEDLNCRQGEVHEDHDSTRRSDVSGVREGRFLLLVKEDCENARNDVPTNSCMAGS
jgi:hypothetical protein